MSAPPAKYYRPGQFIFHEGEPSHSLFLVKKGTVSVRKMKGPAYVEIGRIYTNEVIGELSFFDRLPRSAAAVALTEVEATEIDFKGLEKVLAGVPDYMKTIMAALADRLRKADDQIRRLQREVVSEPGKSMPGEKLDAATVLAATADKPAEGGGDETKDQNAAETASGEGDEAESGEKPADEATESEDSDQD